MCGSTVRQPALVSSASYITAAFTLASRHHGLEAKLLHHCSLHRTAQEDTQRHSHLQRVHAQDNVCPAHKVAHTTRCVNAHIFESSQLESSRFVCRALAVFKSL